MTELIKSCLNYFQEVFKKKGDEIIDSELNWEKETLLDNSQLKSKTVTPVNKTKKTASKSNVLVNKATQTAYKSDEPVNKTHEVFHQSEVLVNETQEIVHIEEGFVTKTQENLSKLETQAKTLSKSESLDKNQKPNSKFERPVDKTQEHAIESKEPEKPVDIQQKQIKEATNKVAKVRYKIYILLTALISICIT